MLKQSKNLNFKDKVAKRYSNRKTFKTNLNKKHKNFLRVISNVGVGYDNIDVEAATKNGVAVFNTPNLMNNAVADLTIGLIISLVRKICDGNEFVKSGQWKGNSWDLFWGENLNSESLGIIGLGNAAKQFALGFNDLTNSNLLAVASKTKEKINFFKDKFKLDDKYCFSKYEDLINCKEIVNCTMKSTLQFSLKNFSFFYSCLASVLLNG